MPDYNTDPWERKQFYAMEISHLKVIGFIQHRISHI